MDWLAKMRLAVDYMESNLEGEVSLEEAARIACSSKYHFHRMFYAMFEVTPAEYVRRRRLTKAAVALSKRSQSVTDIAIRFGYDSPNAFTRAFRKQHGFNPSKINTSQNTMIAFDRADIDKVTKGGAMLEYKIVERPEFYLVGASKSFEFDDFVKEGPKYWKKFVASEQYKTLWDLTRGSEGKVSKAPLISAYFPCERGSRDTFTDVLGIEFDHDVHLPNVDKFHVPAATYAQFTSTYNASMKTNRTIYGEWFSATGYQRDENKPDLAAYYPMAFRPLKDMLIRWWIPIINTDS